MISRLRAASSAASPARSSFHGITRLADPRVRHRSNDLTAPRLRLLGDMLPVSVRLAPRPLLRPRFECVHLVLTPDKLRQSARRRALQPRAQLPEARHLIDLDLLADPLTLVGPKLLSWK
jgi:hypothetical protein